MAGGKLNFSLDIEKLLSAAQGLPGILGQLPAGAPIPAWLQAYAPLISGGAQLFGQFVQVGESASSPGLPDLAQLGPTGKGREVYLRTRNQWTDEQVARAADAILSDEHAPAAVQQMRSAVEFALGMGGESMEGGLLPSFEKMRSAVDSVISGAVLQTPIRDRFGDMLHFTMKMQKGR